jgi:predicted esterase
MSEAQFVEVQDQLINLVDKGNLNEIHSLINKAQIEFPEKLDKTILWEASFYSIQGKQTEAIAAFLRALNEGVWWNPNTLIRDPDLKSLQNLEEFKLIVKKCEDLLESSGHNSKSKLFIFGNQKAEIGIFSLHWKGSNVRDYSSYWLENKMLQDYLFGFPQSSQVYGYNSYCWDNQDIAFKEIEKTYMDFKEGYNIKRCILAGASQGGKLSIELSLNKKLLGINGFIAVIPAIEDTSSIEKLLKEKSKLNLRGCIITGDKDPFYNKTLELMPILEALGIKSKLIVKEGLGHFFPNDFRDLLAEAVEYVLQPY